MQVFSFLLYFVFLLVFPFLSVGIIRKIRARAQGRSGPILFLGFWDIWKFFQKKPVDGVNSGVFAETAPFMTFFSAFIIWTLVVFEWAPFLLIPFFLALYRLSLTGFSMETGTSFGGLGASRESLLSIVSEPILILSLLITQSKITLNFNWLSMLYGGLFLGTFLVAILAEISRPPFDDPRTHLELTMVHEAMILEASGRSLGFFELGSFFKVSSFSVLLIRIGIEHTHLLKMDSYHDLELLALLFLGGIGVSFFLGFWEAVSVRRKWTWVPEIMGMTLLFLLVLGTLIKL